MYNKELFRNDYISRLLMMAINALKRAFKFLFNSVENF